MAQIRAGAMPVSIKWTIRLISVLVLPVPAPATINKGEMGAFAAVFCSGLSCGILEGISTIVGKMESSYKPLIVAVFLGIAGLASAGFVSNKTGLIEVRADSGSQYSAVPAVVGVARGAEMAAADVIGIVPQDNSSQAVDFAATGIIEDMGSPIGPVFDNSEAITYTIKRGDNLSKISASFHVSAADILAANPTLNKKFMRAGATIIIPNGVSAILAVKQNAALPNFNGDFIMPTQGYDYGILHNYNAVDIANSCGTPVVASAEGLVTPDPSIPNVLGGWNGGYGDFILIQHPFGDGVRTRYAHLEKMLVQVGDYVKQGQQIGLMGETGDATGCHLHFEVIGAQNPFAH